MAGAAEVDASWHVGASAGQYASDGTFVGDHGVEPTPQKGRVREVGLADRRLTNGRKRAKRYLKSFK